MTAAENLGHAEGGQKAAAASPGPVELDEELYDECDELPGWQTTWAVLPAYVLLLFLFFVGIAAVCDDHYLPTLVVMAEQLRLTEDVAGASFMAIGSSAPELFTSTLDAFVYQNNIGMAHVVGSAVFNILVMIAATALFSTKPIHINRRPFLRDMTFYFVSVAALFPIMLDSTIRWYEAMSLVVLYVLYITCLVCGDHCLYCCNPPPSAAITDAAIDSLPTPLLEPVADVEGSKEEEQPEQPTTRRRCCACCVACLEAIGRSFLCVFNGVSSAWGFVFNLTIPDCQKPDRKGWCMVSFLACTVWTASFALILAALVFRLGCVLHIPTVVMGATLLSLGTSIPDVLSSMAAVKLDRGNMAVSNAMGSNVFCVTVCLGVPYFIKTAIVNPGSTVDIVDVDSMWKSLITLGVTLVVVGGTFVLSGFVLSRWMGWVYLLTYIGFVVFNFADGDYT